MINLPYRRSLVMSSASWWTLSLRNEIECSELDTLSQYLTIFCSLSWNLYCLNIWIIPAYFQNPSNEKSLLDSPLRSSVIEDKTVKGCSFCCLPWIPKFLSFLLLTFWCPVKLPRLGRSLLGRPPCKFRHPHTSHVFPVFLSFCLGF